MPEVLAEQFVELERPEGHRVVEVSLLRHVSTLAGTSGWRYRPSRGAVHRSAEVRPQRFRHPGVPAPDREANGVRGLPMVMGTA